MRAQWVSLLAAGLCTISLSGQKVALPVAPVRPVIDEYHGVNVSDPYRYIEHLKDPTVQRWFTGQNDYTRAVLDQIPGRRALLSRLRELGRSAPARIGRVWRLPRDRYIYEKALAAADVPSLYLRNGLNGEDNILVNPMRLAKPAEPHHALNFFIPSQNGEYVFYGISPGGSEDAVMRILETATGRQSSESIDRAWFNGAGPTWRPDGRSFFYNRLQKMAPGMPTTEREQKSRVYLHVLGRDPDRDPPVLGFGLTPAVNLSGTDIPFVLVLPNSRNAFGVVAHGVSPDLSIYVAPLDAASGPETPWRKLCDVDDEVTSFAVHGDDIYLLTHKGAPRFKVTRTSIAHPDCDNAEIVVPQSQAVITEISAAQDSLYCQVSDGVVDRLLRLPFRSGNIEPVNLAVNGSILASHSDPRLPGLVLTIASWTIAAKVYTYAPASRQLTDTGLQPPGPYDEPVDLQSTEVKVRSYDGTMVPLSIIHCSRIQRDGKNPTLLQGYGAYGIPLKPSFDPMFNGWSERGGIRATCHVRGGGEYGEEWHAAGKGVTKPNTWRDFIACAEYLVSQHYTSPAKLAILGGSAGGILIGRAITERPDLFAVAITAVGVSDTLRVEKSPNGPPNIPEFGTTKTQAGFEDLYAMSPYAHVRDGIAFPAVMLTTGMNDPRVDPWQAGKMAARLQAATSSRRPVLLRVEYDGGHGIGSTRTQRENELADLMSFALWQFGVPEFEPGAAVSTAVQRPDGR